jgi:hypothetical protein
MSLSILRKAAEVLKAGTGRLHPKTFAEITWPGNLLVADQDYILRVRKNITSRSPVIASREPYSASGEAIPYTVREIALSGPRKIFGAGEHPPRNDGSY